MPFPPEEKRSTSLTLRRGKDVSIHVSGTLPQDAINAEETVENVGQLEFTIDGNTNTLRASIPAKQNEDRSISALSRWHNEARTSLLGSVGRLVDAKAQIDANPAVWAEVGGDKVPAQMLHCLASGYDATLAFNEEGARQLKEKGVKSAVLDEFLRQQQRTTAVDGRTAVC